MEVEPALATTAKTWRPVRSAMAKVSGSASGRSLNRSSTGMEKMPPLPSPRICAARFTQ